MRVVRLVSALALLVTGFGCANDSAQQASPTVPTPEVKEVIGPGPVGVVLKEWSVIAKPATVTAGKVAFEVDNKGEQEHELVVADADGTDPAKLATADDGSVDEDEIEVLDEVEEMKAGASQTLEVDLEPGTYVLFCNVVHEEDMHGMETEVHYKLGMRTALTVV